MFFQKWTEPQFELQSNVQTHQYLTRLLFIPAVPPQIMDN